MSTGFTTPHNLDVERLILSSCLGEADTMDKMVNSLNAEDFFDPTHIQIFSEIKRQRQLGLIPTLDSMCAAFQAADRKKAFSTMVEIYGMRRGFSLIDEWIEILKGLSFQRGFMNIAKDMFQVAAKNDVISRDVLADSFNRMRNWMSNSTKNTFVTMAHLLQNFKEDPHRTFIEEVQHRQELFRDGKPVFNGHKTGFPEIDKFFSGFNPCHFTIVGARPGVGKTTFMNSLMLNLMKSGLKVGCFTLEVSDEQLLWKLLSAHAQVSFKNLSIGSLTGEEFQRVNVSGRDLLTKGLVFDSTPRISIDSLRSRAQGLVEYNGVDIIFIDYLQLISGGPKFRSKYEEITHVSQQLKILSKELKVPLVALAQLNRDADEDNKRPKASDLRDSGALEQDADEIFLLHNKNPEGAGDILEVLLVKNRFGPTGKADIGFCKSESRCYSLQDALKDPFSVFN